MLEQPNCPNLYWALTNLPEPFITCKTALEGERLTLWEFIRDLDSTRPMKHGKIKKFVDRLVEFVDAADSPLQAGGGVRGYLAAQVRRTRRGWPQARERLVASGLSAELVGMFPAVQVILLEETRELRARLTRLPS